MNLPRVGAEADLRPREGAAASGAGLALALLLLAGVALRLIIAYVLYPGSGFQTDLSSFISWSLTLAHDGPGRFYASAGFADYTPAFLFVLWLVGLVAQALSAPLGADPAQVVEQLLKLPSIFMDAGVAYLIYRTVKHWWRSPASPELAALAAAAIYLFNPVTWYDSALWGQADAFGAFVMLAAIVCLVDGYSEASVGLTVLAGLLKPQYGIVLLPIVTIILLRRHLVRPGSGPRPAVRGGWLGDWLTEEQGPWRLVSSLATGAAVAVVLMVPFNLDLPGLLRLVFSTAGEYHYLTVNAYNVWALLGSPSLAQAGTWFDDTRPLFGPIPGFAIGTLLLIVGFLVGVVQVAWHDSRRSILLAAIYFSLAFFALPTRVHERYLFPVFVFLPFAAIAGRRWLVATLVLAAVSFMNLHGVLTLPLYATPNIANLAGGALFRSEPFVIISALGHSAVFVLALLALDPVRTWLARLRGRPAPAPEVLLGPELDPELPLPRAAGRTAGATASLAAAPVAAAGAGSRDGIPAATASTAPASQRDASEPLDGAWPAGTVAVSSAALTAARPGGWRLGLPGWLSDAVALRPLRPDRSRLLFGERGGRVDRLDLLAMALIFVAAMTLRSWRLAEPYGMYFDEVYHARTAMEFLQDWRYGMPHAIYEWTHPHLAKYAMAVGLVAFGDDTVTGTSQLNVSVTGAAIETRWSPPGDPAQRDGDRLYVATGSAVRAYDLQTRGLVATIQAAGATSVAVDSLDHRLFIGSSSGQLWSLSTTSLDALRQQGAGPTQVTAQPLGTSLGSPVTHVVVTPDDAALVAATAAGQLVSVDPTNGQRLASTSAGQVNALLALDPVERVVVDMRQVADPTQAAQQLAAVLGQTPEQILSQMRSGARLVTLEAYVGADQQTKLSTGLQAIPGASLASGSMLAVTGPQGLRIFDAQSLDLVASPGVQGQPEGMAVVDSGDSPTLYVAAGRTLQTFTLASDAPPVSAGTVPMPGQVSDVTWDQASNMVHVLGRTPDGSSPTIYVVDPLGNAVYANANLPFTPAAWPIDQQPSRPSSDRQQILAISGSGEVAAVDVGHHAFAWRIPGVIAGALLAVLLYLLARILFERRSIALLVGAFGLSDGMFFANARIGMNDIYAGLFIVAAYVVFALLYLGRWKGRSAVLVGLPMLGLLLGLALSSKWVGAYAMGGVGLLILLRSALGRVLALGVMVILTGLLGNIAISHAPGVASPQLNFTFLILLVGLTYLLAVANVVRPVRFTLEEMRFAVAAPLAAGILVGLVAFVVGPHLPSTGRLTEGRLLIAGFGLVVLSGVAYAAFSLGGRFGIGPLAPPPVPGSAGSLLEAPSAPPEGWLLPGAGRGIPWLWAIGCITVLPLVVYVISYVPWINLGNQWWPGFPAGHTGQTFMNLQLAMYDYHNNLRATHPASSPWWAWPFDLKPVWFYQGSLANDSGASIYDSGNLVLFWLSIPAMGWAIWQSWRRRSLPLTLVVMAGLSQWLVWTWIDRATFQYHYFTALPFIFLALAYFMAELWLGPSRQTWALARAAAALAVLGPAILWLLKAPLCVLAGVATVDATSQVCGAVVSPVAVTARVAVMAAIVLVGVIAVVWQVRLLGDESGGLDETTPGEGWSDGDGMPSGLAGWARHYRWVLATGAVTLLALTIAQATVSDAPLFSFGLGSVGSYLVALVAGLLLAVPAWLVLHARDPRRFVLGFVILAALWLVVWYPNLSALPLPGAVVNAYQGLLPTWIYDFQFTVNLSPPANTPIFGSSGLLLTAMIGVGALAVTYAARAWRQELAVRRAEREAPGEGSAGTHV